MENRYEKLFLKAIILALIVGLYFSVSGCASMTEEYWQTKWEELPEAEKQRYKSNAPGEGLPIMVCDLTDCIFVWVY